MVCSYRLARTQDPMILHVLIQLLVSPFITAERFVFLWLPELVLYMYEESIAAVPFPFHVVYSYALNEMVERRSISMTSSSGRRILALLSHCPVY